MRKTTVQLIILLSAIGICCMIASCSSFGNKSKEQVSERPTWLPCPNCLSTKETREAESKTANLKFDPHDLSGVWRQHRVQLSLPAPPFTARGKELYDATKADDAADGSTQTSNTKD